MKTEFIKQVNEFMTVFNQPRPETPIIPTPDRTKLRLDLIHEEYKELEEAIKNNNLIEIIDAFCDLQYVLSGAIIEFGLGNKFKRLFNEVNDSNMTKFCKTREEADLTIEKYKKEGIDTYSKLVVLEDNKYFIIYRSTDNKVLKSINYVKPNFNNILNEDI